MAYSARVLKDSLSPDGVRLTTVEVTFPRIVLAEFNTHRVFSRNSASSRAIPVEKMLKRVIEDPFVPIYWGKNQKGMQADREVTAEEIIIATNEWLQARDYAVAQAKSLLALGIHKQITNRLLEPFLWQTVLVTSSEWDNWNALRRHPDAQPEIKRAADIMYNVRNASIPTQLHYGEWHLPLTPEVDDIIAQQGVVDWAYWKKVSTGRCARVSLLTHDGKRDPAADIELGNRLLVSGHMSPFEHIARPLERKDVASWESCSTVFKGNFRGWFQYRKELLFENNYAAAMTALNQIDEITV
jgi:hypothetical protein